jgi:DNA-binding response OmpR family regulator
VTAYAMQGDRERVLSSGFDGYLSKPINATLLAEELERLLRKRDGQNADLKESQTESNRKKQAANAGNDMH